MIDVDTKVAQKSSCSIMLSISRVVSQLIARAAPPPPHVAYLRITQSLLLPCSSFLFDIIFSQQVQQQSIEQYINPQWGQSRFQLYILLQFHEKVFSFHSIKDRNQTKNLVKSICVWNFILAPLCTAWKLVHGLGIVHRLQAQLCNSGKQKQCMSCRIFVEMQKTIFILNFGPDFFARHLDNFTSPSCSSGSSASLLALQP